MRPSALLTALTLWLAVVSYGRAQESRDAVARVRVVDASGRPVRGAKVAFPDLKLSSTTDSDGYALITGIDPGDHTFEVTKSGFGKASTYLHLTAGAIGEGTIALAVKPTPIEGITVRVRPVVSEQLKGIGFYDRKRMGIGRQYDEQAMDSLRLVTVPQLFNRLPAHGCDDVSLGLDAGAPTMFSQRGADAAIASTRSSAVGSGLNTGGRKVFINGQPADDRDLHDQLGRGEMPLYRLAGVEVYNGPEVPASYAGLDTSCGAILLWLR